MNEPEPELVGFVLRFPVTHRMYLLRDLHISHIIHSNCDQRHQQKYDHDDLSPDAMHKGFEVDTTDPLSEDTTGLLPEDTSAHAAVPDK